VVGSAIGGLVYDGIQVRSEPPGIDPRRSPASLGNRYPRHEPARWNGPELRDGYSVARDDDGLSCLNFPQDSAGVIPQFSLRDGSFH
jgi:hypothetical protein